MAFSINRRLIFFALALAGLPASAWAQGATGIQVIVRLRLSGDASVLPPLRSCIADRLGQKPDVKVVVQPADGVRFFADIDAAKGGGDDVTASLVVVQTFPMESFRPRIKSGEDADALLKSIQYFTLQRLHELVRAPSSTAACDKIVSDIATKVLSAEYTARDD